MSDPTTVLVASGDAGTRAQVLLTLGDERFDVREAEDTDATLRIIAEELPPVVVLDVNLAGAGALAVARTLRRQPETATARVLVLTRRDAPVAADAQGVDATLALPFTAFALLGKVETLLEPGSDAVAGADTGDQAGDQAADQAADQAGDAAEGSR